MKWCDNLSNLHTHTLFCDGKNSPEEMVCSAIEKGLSVLGFSGHSMYPFSSDWHIASKEHKNYCDEIKRLKDKYKEKLCIELGFEADYIPGLCAPVFSNFSEFAPEFLIGSVHYIYNEKKMFAIDNTPQELIDGINNVFGGNVKTAISHYFSMQREMLASGSFTIIGHPDLIRKFNTKINLFDENESWYKKELEATADAIKRSGVIAEINTGAIARGHMNDAYPSDYFLSLLHERNVPITISSDAHAANAIDSAFDFAQQKAKKAGYKEIAVPKAGSVIFFDL